MSRLKDWIKHRGLTQRGFGDLIGKTDAYVSDFANTDREIRRTTRQRFADALGITLEEFDRGPVSTGEESDFTSRYTFVRFYDATAHQEVGSIIGVDSKYEIPAFPTAWIREELRSAPESLILLRASGDSMLPCICESDILLVDKSRNNLHQDGIYVFRNNGSLLVKRIELRVGGQVICKSDNPAYGSYELSRDGDTQVYGRVVWIGRKLV